MGNIGLIIQQWIEVVQGRTIAYLLIDVIDGVWWGVIIEERMSVLQEVL